MNVAVAQTMIVAVAQKDAVFDVEGRRAAEAAQRAGFSEIQRCRSEKLFYLLGELSSQQLESLTHQLLLDPVLDEWHQQKPSGTFVEVALRPGVTDTEGENLLKAAHRLGFTNLKAAATGCRYFLETERLTLVAELLANPVIELFSINQELPPPFVRREDHSHQPQPIPLEGDLEKLSKDLLLALNLEEMEKVKAHYQELGRAPTRTELETLAQTWSEHCVHKTFRALIDYTENGQTREVDGLLPLLRQATEELNLDWVESAFVDNAGIVKFDDDWSLAIKAETHNHPSALEPFGGANTGVGGVIRDVLGVSARPIANWDVLCFGEPEAGAPEGSLPAAQIIEGVVHGVADYGNKMGIPTVAGAVVFHPGYTANPLVYCGCLGILPGGGHPTGVRPQDHIVLVGGLTGRDGLGGATFSSLEMGHTTAEECGTAVQIGHPIQEKLASELVLAARKKGLYHAVTDCGAGGLASAVGEMGSKLGAEVHLERVPTKYPGLTPRELWLSEAQERMVLAVSDQNWAELQELAKAYDVVCVSIGRFQEGGRLRLKHQGIEYADLDMHFLHKGIPRQRLTAVWEDPEIPEKPVALDTEVALLKLLSDLNISSREPILRRYDHEVQGGTSVKPLSVHNGPGDGVALVPLEVQDQERPPAAVLGCGINPYLTDLDPRLGTFAAVDEAIRNVVACGADPDRISLLDNFSWGNPRLPDRLGALTRSCLACAEASRLYKAPFVSGKDSLNNEFLEAGGRRRAIPGTILITAVGRLQDVHQRLTTSLQSPGNLLYLLGPECTSLGGSTVLRLFGGSSGELPQPYMQAPEMYRAFYRARTWVKACHDLSEGGLGVALAEMCLASGLGAGVDEEPATLFSEGPSRLVVEVAPEEAADFEEALQGFPLRKIGAVLAKPALRVGDLELPIERLRAAFETDHFACLGGYRQSAQPRALKAVEVPPMVSHKPPVAILAAPGTNREQDAARAVAVAGGLPEILSTRQEIDFGRYALVILPGGFSYGDDLGSGRLWCLDLAHHKQNLDRFVEKGGALLGICNGFQALVRSGYLTEEPSTLTHNQSEHFECRWVDLEVDPDSPSLFTRGLTGVIRCPVAHGEGRFHCHDHTFEKLLAGHQIPLRYAQATYPHNPNGSRHAIAAVCNPAGNVMGLMPHPENNIYGWQSEAGDVGAGTGLALFTNALRNLR